MTCFHIPYLILSHVPFLFILSFIFFQSFRIEGKLSYLGLLRLETFGPWEDSTEDYLFWSDVDVPYKGVNPSLGSLFCLGHQPLLLLDIVLCRFWVWLDRPNLVYDGNPQNRSSVELGKFDPPLWHAPYGRIV